MPILCSDPSVIDSEYTLNKTFFNENRLFGISTNV